MSRSVPAVRPAPQSASASAPDMELDDAEPRKPLLPPSPASKGYATTNTSGKIVAPEEIISDARAFFGELMRSDKIAFGGCCLVILSCFLPWKETAAEGDVLGLMSAGAGALIGAAIVIGSIFIRVRRSLPKFNPLVPWAMQLGVSFFSLLYTVVFIKSAFDTTEVPSAIGNRLIMNSSPSFGVFLGLLGTIAALTGSVMGLRERT
ncbi:MAG: hypothetical protein ACJ8AT_37145 [Hyalangium sp.]|uniref:hypothetical protein n=1 Tax=Hyalangium sp. TaxID=2028555 RepID=UPI00389AD0A2